MDKEVVEKLLRLSKGLAEMLELTYQSFRKLTEKSIWEVDQARNEVRKSSTELTSFLIVRSRMSDERSTWAKPFLSMASSFDRMMYNIEGITNQLRMMIGEGTPLSDRAVKEINDIFQEAMNLLERLPDLILTPDKSLAQQIGEQVRSVMKIAESYSEQHEDRLIQGVCVPKSSPIYLGVIESLKGVIAHTLEVSGKLVSRSVSPSTAGPPPLHSP